MKIMGVAPLTAPEIKWVKEFQALMKKCPTKRLGAYTTGDASLSLYDKPMFETYRENASRDNRDDVIIHDELGTVLANIVMPFQVDGVCG